MTRTEVTSKLLQLSTLNQVQEFHRLISCESDELNWKEVTHRRSGDTVAHVASRSGSLDILKYLKDNTRCDFEQVNLDGKRPLHEAAQAGQTECVKFLISRGVSVDPLKRADWTPLMLACTKDNLDVIRELLSANANPKLQNKDGWNSFHIACREGRMNVIAHLLERLPDIWQTTSKNGRIPLHTAAFHGHTAVADALLSVSLCALNVKDRCGSTALMDACRFEHVDTAKLLYEKYGADLYEVDALGQNCLHVAAQANAIKSIDYLVNEAGMNVNATTCSGQTPLHLAAKEGHDKTLALLLELGAKRDVLDNNNRTAAFIAQASGFSVCFDLLKSKE